MHSLECNCIGNKLLWRIILKLIILYMFQMCFFRDFIDSFRNIGGAQTIIARINFQEEFFNLELSGMALYLIALLTLNPQPYMFFCQYASRKIKIYDYENREPTTACIYYGLSTHIFEIKNNLGINIGIVSKLLILACKSMLININ